MNSNVKINSDGTWKGTHITVGGEEIRASDMRLELDRNSYSLKLTLSTFIDLADLEIADGNTELILKSLIPGSKDRRVQL